MSILSSLFPFIFARACESREHPPVIGPEYGELAEKLHGAVEDHKSQSTRLAVSFLNSMTDSENVRSAVRGVLAKMESERHAKGPDG